MVKEIPPDPGTHPLFTHCFVWGCVFPVALVFAPCPDPPVYLESSLNAGDLHRLCGCRGGGGTEGTKDSPGSSSVQESCHDFSLGILSSRVKRGKRPSSSVSTSQISERASIGPGASNFLPICIFNKIWSILKYLYSIFQSSTSSWICVEMCNGVSYDFNIWKIFKF